MRLYLFSLVQYALLLKQSLVHCQQPRVLVEHKSDSSHSRNSCPRKWLCSIPFYSFAIPATSLSLILLHCLFVLMPITYSYSIAFYFNSLWILLKLLMSLRHLSSCQDVNQGFSVFPCLYLPLFEKIHLCDKDKKIDCLTSELLLNIKTS